LGNQEELYTIELIRVIKIKVFTWYYNRGGIMSIGHSHLKCERKDMNSKLTLSATESFRDPEFASEPASAFLRIETLTPKIPWAPPVRRKRQRNIQHKIFGR
jgi:hypothetical protein